MTGRGIDQALPHPGDPRIYENHVVSAFEYVTIAEEANGPISRPVGFSYIWGDSLAELSRARPDARIINLETSITRCEAPEPKQVNYKMSPENVPCLAAAGIDCCVLANNHVLDWGSTGLNETLETLSASKLRHVGAGRNLEDAAAPAIIEVAGKGRVIIFAFGSVTSGIPREWAATPEKAGVNLLADFSGRTAGEIATRTHAVRRVRDLIVGSIHWGGNWGYEIDQAAREFAHRLIDDAAVDVVHGHSSHHAKAIEVYRDKPILYGCGDFLNDYEGIGGYEVFRDDLALMYFVTFDMLTRKLVRLEMTPLQIRNFRLHRASREDAQWLRDTLCRESAVFGAGVELADDNRLRLTWRCGADERWGSDAEMRKQP